MNEKLELPLQAQWIIEEVQTGKIKQATLNRRRSKALKNKDWNTFVCLGLAMAYLTSLEKFKAKEQTVI